MPLQILQAAEETTSNSVSFFAYYCIPFLAIVCGAHRMNTVVLREFEPYAKDKQRHGDAAAKASHILKACAAIATYMKSHKSVSSFKRFMQVIFAVF